MNIENIIDELEQQWKECDSVYHSVAVKYDISDTAFWVLYILAKTETVCTQQDLCKKSFWAKQTINTAVSSMIKRNLIQLESIPGTRNQKQIVLTESGKEFVDHYMVPVVEKEICAYQVLSDEELKLYLEMTKRLTASVRSGFSELIDGKE